MSTRRAKIFIMAMARPKDVNCWCLCDNCGAIAKAQNLIPLEEVKDLNDRLDEGGEVPAGECKKCGALSYVIDLEANAKKYIKSGGAHCLVCGGAHIEADTPKTDDLAIVCDIVCTLCGSRWQDIHTVTSVENVQPLETEDKSNAQSKNAEDDLG